MIHDIFVPCRVGNYYLHTKRVLSIEISPFFVQGILIVYSGTKIMLQEKATVFLKDTSEQVQINALKKIVGTFKKVDEVVTTLASSVIIFKELKLPFLGRETLKMVIPFEVENILPFALSECVIDFLITHEDIEKKISTVLVAAVRKEDIQHQYDLFAKADISLHVLNIDVFALYRLYKVSFEQNVSVKTLGHKKSFLDKLFASPKKLYFYGFNKIKSILPSKIHPSLVYHQEILPSDFKPVSSDVLIDID